MTTKYFFASVVYDDVDCMDYYGERIEMTRIQRFASRLFQLDHYPNEEEVILNVVGHSHVEDATVLSYNEVNKQQFEAWH